MPLHVCSTVTHNRIADGMGFIEGIACKVKDFIVNAVGNRLRNSIGNCAGDTACFVAVDKSNPFGIDHRMFFLAHGSADHVRLSE